MSKAVQTVFGGRGDSGILGLGQFRPEAYNIDKRAVLEADIAKNKDQVAARQQQQAFAQQLQALGMGTAQTEAQRMAMQGRAGQTDLVSALQAQARGEGPSLAQMQLQEATDRTLSQAAGAAASQRGVNPALAARQALLGQAGATQQAARDSAMIRAQEQLSAQQQLGQQLQALRGQDLAVTEAERAERATAMGAVQNLRQQDIDVADADRAARMGLESMGVQQATGLAGAAQAGYADAAKRRVDFISGLGEGATTKGMKTKGMATAFSDENKKQVTESDASATKDTKSFVSELAKAIKPTETKQPEEKESGHSKMGSGIGLLALKAMSDSGNKKVIKDAVKEELTSFVDALNAHKYEYKDDVKDMAGEGEYVSPMAQELEKTELGKDMVIDTPEGKMVDYGKGFGTMLASQAVLNDRLSDIEKALKMKKGSK